jgi:hypothetical protein
MRLKWLLRLRDETKVTEVLVTESVGCNFEEIATIMSVSIEALLVLESEYWDYHNKEVETYWYITTRQIQREAGNRPSSKELPGKRSDKASRGTSRVKVVKGKARKEPKASIKRIPELGNKPTFQNITMAPITIWIVKQLVNQEISKSLSWKVK